MNKQYRFLFLVGIFLIVSYLVLSFKYNEYNVKQTMNVIVDSNKALRTDIKETRLLIDYKSSRAYKNKILKQQEGLKSKGETVLFITTESDFKKYTAPYKLEIADIEQQEEDKELEGLTNIEKWQRFLFGK